MKHLLQCEYDELVAAQEELARLRVELDLRHRAMRARPAAERARLLIEAGRSLVLDAEAMGMHITIERHTRGAPSMANVSYDVEAWPDQRAA